MSWPERWLENACPLGRRNAPGFSVYRTAVPTAMNSRCSPPSPWWRQVEADADDPVGIERIGFSLHARHRIPARPVGRLGQDTQFLLLPDAGELVADVIDRDAHHQLDRFEPGPVQERELVDR